MKKSLAALALAFILPAGLAMAAPQSVVSPSQQEALQPGQQAQDTADSSYRAFKANINPSVVVPTTGVYDQGDAFTGRHGFPLEGWSQVRLPNEN
jgi:hypothetical protein